jgi:hypothetical protein
MLTPLIRTQLSGQAVRSLENAIDAVGEDMKKKIEAGARRDWP